MHYGHDEGCMFTIVTKFVLFFFGRVTLSPSQRDAKSRFLLTSSNLSLASYSGPFLVFSNDPCVVNLSRKSRQGNSFNLLKHFL